MEDQAEEAALLVVSLQAEQLPKAVLGAALDMAIMVATLALLRLFMAQGAAGALAQ